MSIPTASRRAFRAASGCAWPRGEAREWVEDPKLLPALGLPVEWIDRSPAGIGDDLSHRPRAITAIGLKLSSQTDNVELCERLAQVEEAAVSHLRALQQKAEIADAPACGARTSSPAERAHSRQKLIEIPIATVNPGCS